MVAWVSLSIGLVATPSAAQLSFTPVTPLNTNANSDFGDDAIPNVTTDGAGNWVAVWHSNDSLGSTIGTDSDILVSRSSDNGESWTAPVALGTNAANDTGDDGNPEVATDGLGNWVAVWWSGENVGGTIGSDNDILFSRSVDAGSSWSAPQALNTNATTDASFDTIPEIATDGAGNWVVVWWSNEDLGGTIGSDNDILIARSVDAGVSWSDPAALAPSATTDSGSDIEAQLTTDGAGNWVAVWQSDDSLGASIGTDTDILVSRSANAGLSWTTPVALSSNADSDSGADGRAQVTTDGAGNWMAVWHSSDTLFGTLGTDSDILFATSTDAGVNWSVTAALGTNADSDTGDDLAPQLTHDGVQTWLAIWRSTDDVGGTIGADNDVLMALSDDVGATWTSPAALASNATIDTGEDFNPRLTTDGLGRWVAVWFSTDDLSSTIGSDEDILFSTALGPDTDTDGLADAAEVNLHGTDPFDDDSDDDGATDGAELTAGTDPNDPDSDDDGVCDGSNSTPSCAMAGPDNCPFVSNASQDNTDGLGAGDACQCGDANTDGFTNDLDLRAVRENLVGATLSGPFDSTRCDFVGALGCEIDDAFVLARILAAAAGMDPNGCVGYGAP